MLTSLYDNLVVKFGLFSDPDLENVLQEGHAHATRSSREQIFSSTIRILLTWAHEDLHRVYLLTNFCHGVNVYHGGRSFDPNSGNFIDSEVGVTQKCYVLERRGAEVVCMPRGALKVLSVDDSAKYEARSDWFYCDDSLMLSEFNNSLSSICRRFGLKIAIMFGYFYILGRLPDPGGLNEKMRDVVTGRRTISQICNELLASDEFQRCGVRILPHPDLVIGSWAVLNQVGNE